MKARLLIIFLKFLSLLPLNLSRQVGSLLGVLMSCLPVRMSKVTQINLALCCPELDETKRNSLAKKSIKQTFTMITEMGAIWFWPKNRVIDMIQEIEGLELLESAYAEGKGVVVIAPHLGNWELLGLYLGVCGCGEVSQLYQPPKSHELDKLIFTARSRFGAKMVETNNKGVASLLRDLRKGGVVGVLPDQVPPESSGEFASFFSNNALTMTLVSRLLQKTGARAVLAYAKRQPGGFKIVFREPTTGLYSEQMSESLEALNASVESLVRESPEQYQWEYKRFRRQPEGQPRPY